MNSQVTVIAHRGASRRTPENTLAAIRAAVKDGADMVEVDVQMTRDRALVLLHDSRLERTTDGAGFVAGMSSFDLAKLDAGAWKDLRFAGERIPLLAEALEATPDGVRINLDLKPTSERETLLEALLPIVNRENVKKRLLLATSDAVLLRELVPLGFSTALITDHHGHGPLRTRAAVELTREIGCVAWHPNCDTLTPGCVRYAHACGLKVNTWTVDNPIAMLQLLAWGVDGIFTNTPRTLRSILQLRPGLS